MDGQSSTSTPNVDPAGVAVSLGENDFCVVRVVTREGAEYVFPDMSLSQLKKVIPDSGRTLESMPSLMLVNVSVAILSLPFRVIKQIRAGEEVLWDCPA